MKLFSILNKPAVKANNKQAGIVFLEYVIMAFIATVAIICAIWWLYWHLQQMTWEIKDRLKTLPRTCPLGTPYGAAPEDQPTAFYQKTYEAIADLDGALLYTDEIPYPHYKIVIHNTDPTNDIEFRVYYRTYINKEIDGNPPAWWYYVDNFTLVHGDKYEQEFDNGWIIDYFMINYGVDVSSDIGPYNTRIIATGPDGTPYTVTVTKLP